MQGGVPIYTSRLIAFAFLINSQISIIKTLLQRYRIYTFSLVFYMYLIFAISSRQVLPAIGLVFLVNAIRFKSKTISMPKRFCFYFSLFLIAMLIYSSSNASIRILNLFFDEARLNLLIFTLNQYPISLLGNGLGNMISQFSTYPHNLFLELLSELGVFPFALFICVLSIYILNVCSYLHHSLFNGNTDLSVLLKYVFYGYVFSIITSLFSGALLVNISVFFFMPAFSILYINVRANDDFAGSSD